MSLFPDGEIRLDGERFVFRLTNKTHAHSVISHISWAERIQSTDAIQVLINLCECKEPKRICENDREVQSLQHSTYALFCYYQNLGLSLNRQFDCLFRNVDLQNLRDSFGVVRENLLPLGIVLRLCRIQTERKIRQALEQFNNFAAKNLIYWPKRNKSNLKL